MGKPTGFMEYERKDAYVVPENERIGNFEEFHTTPEVKDQQIQAARCMDCGVPFCQAGALIAGMASGCPLHNLIPETNDLVFRGSLKLAYERLSMSHPFPEFTSRVCPALCEAACTCNLHCAAVTTKENERTIIEYAYENDLVKAAKPAARTGKKVAVIGSGPSGLSVAHFLNMRGHEVTIYERRDRIGGLLRYGIPNMKLDKKVIDRRVKLMEEAGINFKVNADVGKDIDPKDLMKEYDALILACGASNPRDIKAEGRDAKGIRFAVDYLSEVTKRLLDSDFKDVPFGLAKDKNVIVIGGGDTGNDCVGTSIRLGCKSVTQLEMMPCPPFERTASNPWPEWPKVLKTDYGQEEAIYKLGHDPRVYCTTVKEFKKNKKGELLGVVTISLKPEKDEKTGRMNMVPVEGSEKELPADLVLIAAGFLGSEKYVTDGFKVELDGRTNVKTPTMEEFNTSVKNVYVVGDMHRGQSLVVWAISEGKNAARQIDKDLMGYTNL